MKGFFAFALLVLLTACGNNTKVPKGIIPPDQMTNVMWDVMLADNLATHRYPTDSLKRFDTSVVLYQEIAKAHNTTQAQLKKSLQYYEGHPDLLQVIFDTLQKRAQLPLQAQKKDTLKKKFHPPVNPLP